MRLYYMTSEQWGIAALRDQRLKIARFSELNDVFELRNVQSNTPSYFSAERLDQYFGILGVLCFSESWESPVMWAHYADRHRGLCLGFEVPDVLARTVKYDETFLQTSDRPVFDPHARDIQEALDKFSFHKFKEWEYERERRMFCKNLELDKLAKIHFRSFDENLRLAEVVIGCRSTLVPTDFEDLLSGQKQTVQVWKSMPSGNQFKMIEEPVGRRAYSPVPRLLP